MKSQTFHIEPAGEADWPWIEHGEVEIAWTRLGGEWQRETSPEAVEEQVVRRVERLRSDKDFDNQAFVARAEDGALAGFVWVAKDQNDSTGQMEALLLNQYVAKAYRGQGLGRRLMEMAEDWAKGQKLPRISLAVGVGNAIGQRLYESLGYQAEALRMSKTLDPEAPDEILLIND
jgi:ribosomal protein S18 acetylase RimI-like enzyme